MAEAKSPIDHLKDSVGVKRGPSPWRTVTQEDVNAFADLTGDHQWIHVDVERATRESPYGAPIAHGDLTLCLIAGLVGPLELLGEDDVEVGINYGWNRVRFPAPVPVGSQIRATVELASVEDKGNGWWELVDRVTVEVDGAEKPACVAENVVRIQLTQD
jgi:acyl dehydratase